jgi:hypothetical protein
MQRIYTKLQSCQCEEPFDPGHDPEHAEGPFDPGHDPEHVEGPNRRGIYHSEITPGYGTLRRDESHSFSMTSINSIRLNAIWH